MSPAVLSDMPTYISPLRMATKGEGAQSEWQYRCLLAQTVRILFHNVRQPGHCQCG